MSQHLVTLLLGSNLGDREKNIETALIRIESSVGEIIEKTEILYTAPVAVSYTHLDVYKRQAE